MSNRQYGQTGGFEIGHVIRALRLLADTSDHQFWIDSISITDNMRFDSDRLHGPSQLTDVYLLGLAVENKGRFVTYDRRVPISTVRSARQENLLVLEGL